MLVWLTTRVDRRLAETIASLKNRGIKQVVYRQYASDFGQVVRDIGVAVEWLPLSPRRIREAAMIVAGNFSGQTGVVFHAVGSHATSVALMANKICRYLRATVISEVDPAYKLPWWHRYARIGHFSNLVDAIVVREPFGATAFHVRKSSGAISKMNLNFVRYGFDSDRYGASQKQNSDPVTIGISVKGLKTNQIRILLQMLNWIPEGPNLKFIFFGPVATLAIVERMAHSYFESAFSLLRFVRCDDIAPQHWKKCDISIHTLNQPIAGAELIDAIGCGAVPIIKSDDSCEPVKDGKTGFLVKPGNPLALKQALEMLTADLTLRIEMAMAGRQLIEDSYNLKDTVTHLCDIYDAAKQDDGGAKDKEMSVGAGS